MHTLLQTPSTRPRDRGLRIIAARSKSSDARYLLVQLGNGFLHGTMPVYRDPSHVLSGAGGALDQPTGCRASAAAAAARVVLQDAPWPVPRPTVQAQVCWIVNAAQLSRPSTRPISICPTAYIFLSSRIGRTIRQHWDQENYVESSSTQPQN